MRILVTPKSLTRGLPASDHGDGAVRGDLGVVGCGSVGGTVVKLASGLGMKTLGYDPFPAASFQPPGFRCTEFVETEAVLAALDSGYVAGYAVNLLNALREDEHG